MNTETKQATQSQAIKFQLLPTGEINIEGALNEKQQSEIATQIFEAAYSQRRIVEKQLEEITKWNNVYQHFIILTLLIFGVFTISFVLSRSIKNALHSQVQTHDRQYFS